MTVNRVVICIAMAEVCDFFGRKAPYTFGMWFRALGSNLEGSPPRISTEIILGEPIVSRPYGKFIEFFVVGGFRTISMRIDFWEPISSQHLCTICVSRVWLLFIWLG